MHQLSLFVSLQSWLTVLASANAMPSQAEVFATATTTSSGAEPTFTIAKRRMTYDCNQDDRLMKIEAQAWANARAIAEIVVKYDEVEGNVQKPIMYYWMG